MWRCLWVVLLVAAITLAASLSHAQKPNLTKTLTLNQVVKQPLVAEEMQLKGIYAEWSNFISVDEKKHRSTQPILTVAWRKSDIVNSQRSTLTVLIDGQPLRTTWLPKEDRGEFTFSLPELAGGVREIGIRVSMHVDGDPCLNFRRDDAWLAISAQSNISWTRARTLPTRATVSQLPGSWPRVSGGDRSIAVEYDGTLDTAGMGAYLDIDHLLRSWSFSPVPAWTENAAGRVKLSTLRQPDNVTEAAKKLAINPEARFALGFDTSATLHIVARDSESLRDAISLLGSSPARQLCTQSVCLGGAQAKRSAPAIGAVEKRIPAPTEVWHLGASTNGRPWVARGFGSNQTRFVWQRPAWWQITEWPTLQLTATTSASSAIDRDKSVISVRVNDQPLATYTVSQWLANKAEIRIPRELWTASEWVVDITSSLQPTDSERCSITDQSTHWVSIGADTSLKVPRKETQHEGIARFYLDTLAADLPSIYIETPSLDKLAALAPVVQPFLRSQSTVQLTLPRPQFVGLDACQTQRCIQLRDALPNDTPLKYLDGKWIDRGGTLGVPFVNSKDSLAMFYVAPSGSQASKAAQLILVTGDLSRPLPSDVTPDFRGLIGRVALFSEGKWHALDIQSRGSALAVTNPDAPRENQPTENISDQQRKLRWLNFVWAALSVLVVSALMIWLWRKPASKQPDKNWEVHE